MLIVIWLIWMICHIFWNCRTLRGGIVFGTLSNTICIKFSNQKLWTVLSFKSGTEPIKSTYISSHIPLLLKFLKMTEQFIKIWIYFHSYFLDSKLTNQNITIFISLIYGDNQWWSDILKRCFIHFWSLLFINCGFLNSIVLCTCLKRRWYRLKRWESLIILVIKFNKWKDYCIKIWKKLLLNFKKH